MPTRMIMITGMSTTITTTIIITTAAITITTDTAPPEPRCPACPRTA